MKRRLSMWERRLSVFCLTKEAADEKEMDDVLGLCCSGGDFTGRAGATPTGLVESVRYGRSKRWRSPLHDRLRRGRPRPGPAEPVCRRIVSHGKRRRTVGGGIARWDGMRWTDVGGSSPARSLGINAMIVFDEDGDGPELPKLFAAGTR